MVLLNVLHHEQLDRKVTLNQKSVQDLRNRRAKCEEEVNKRSKDKGRLEESARHLDGITRQFIEKVSQLTSLLKDLGSVFEHLGYFRTKSGERSCCTIWHDVSDINDRCCDSRERHGVVERFRCRVGPSQGPFVSKALNSH